MVKQFLLIYLCLCTLCTTAQPHNSLRNTTATKQVLLTVNQALDKAAVDKNAAFMQKHYAPDFYFLHGTGQVDSKKSWMNYVLDSTTQYRSRSHDSVQVELHKNIAILAGTLTVKRPAQNKFTGYALRYIRVYVYGNKRWQLLSHRTTQEWHLPDAPL